NAPSPAEPTQSPASLALELALFTVPTGTSPAASEADAVGRRAGGSEGKGAGEDAPGDISQGVASKGDAASAGGATGEGVSRDASGTGRKFTTFGWDEWEVRPEREFSLRSCRETPVDPSSCFDLGDVPPGDFRGSCVKAMPPTSEAQFAYKLPVNNKWVVPERVLKRNAASIINAPEFDVDFSVEYDLTYSADVIE
ncbi:hypothetical protein T484DRAFT_1802994, partial [Baffinella frigidus]